MCNNANHFRLFCLYDFKYGYKAVWIGARSVHRVFSVTDLAIVNYLHQKYLIYNSVTAQISDIFINTYIIHRITGMILDRVQNLSKLDDLNYRSILGMADLNIGFATSMNTKLFSPIVGLERNIKRL